MQGYFCTRCCAARTLRQESLGRWLHGEEVSPEDMRDLRSIGVTEKINKNNAFKMLRSLCQVVRALGYTGLALLFDEGDRMLSVGGRSEKVATDNLREVIDRCREDLPGALFLYAVPPAFIYDIVPKYPALQQRIQAPGYFSRANPFSPQISLDRLDLPDERVADRDRLRGCCRSSRSPTASSSIPTFRPPTSPCWPRRPATSYLAISHRRLFIKALVTEWFRQKEEGERAHQRRIRYRRHHAARATP